MVEGIDLQSKIQEVKNRSARSVRMQAAQLAIPEVVESLNHQNIGSTDLEEQNKKALSLAKYEQQVQKEFSAKSQQFRPAFDKSKKLASRFKMAESLQQKTSGVQENPALVAKINRQQAGKGGRQMSHQSSLHFSHQGSMKGSDSID